MGRRPADPRIHDLDGMLEALVRWMRERAGDAPVILAGTSAGAYLALGALARPDIRLDVSVDYRDAWRLMPGFPRPTFVTPDRAEHGVPVDQQKVFAALVDDWLDRLDEDRAARPRGEA